MKRSVDLIFLFALALQACTTLGSTQDYADKLLDKLLDRVLEASQICNSLQHIDLDQTTFAKSGHLSSPLRASAKGLTFPSLSGGRKPPVVDIKMHRVLEPNSAWTPPGQGASAPSWLSRSCGLYTRIGKMGLVVPKAQADSEPAENAKVETVQPGQVGLLHSEDQFDEHLADSSGMIVLMCCTQWCGPCKLWAPIYEKIAADYKKVKFLKATGDENDSTENLFARLSVRSVPYFYFLRSDETESSGWKLVAEEKNVGESSLRSTLDGVLLPEERLEENL